MSQNNWDADEDILELETASWRWMDDEIVCTNPDNDEFIPQQE
jgi:hypothetical protein